ncbi:LytR/AlgR family response regulator transcription factor [Yeosuana aromativorans]|uniref:LytR/AlgR family response regulator transcription factor n=1 Tax=Yeosuana aromativorans TaxID=288019 RepID=UPI00166370B1|nr:LytTR family DNA-binding domain-containing protein [Yeosuana aromativorans]
MEQILTEQPDVVLLNMDGVIDQPLRFVLELYLYDITIPHFIGISSNKDQVYQAMKHGFYDYLLTPISRTEIRKSFLRYQKIYRKAPELVCLKSYKDYHYLDTSEILFLKADNNTTDFHMLDGKIITAFKTLKTYEDQLPDHFKRIHKSYIINISKVTRIDFGKAQCKLANIERSIPFSKKFKDNIDDIHRSLYNASYHRSN